MVLQKTDNPNFTGTDFYDIIKIDNRIILKSYPLNLENSVEKKTVLCYTESEVKLLVKCGRVKGTIKMSDNPFSFIPDLNMDGKRD